MLTRLYGAVVPIITPFDEEEHIDTASLKQLTETIIQSGLQGLYPCGTTGEMLLLSVEERKLVVETVVRTAAGRIPVFARTAAMRAPMESLTVREEEELLDSLRQHRCREVLV